nr:hypothetical protein [uncultured Sphingomonas sp.]
MIVAAELAGADEFITRLPQGYDTIIEECGTDLSGGHRLAIARAQENADALRGRPLRFASP